MILKIQIHSETKPVRIFGFSIQIKNYDYQTINEYYM